MKAYQFFALASLIMAAPHYERLEAKVVWVVFGVLAVVIYLMERVDGRREQ